MEPDTWDAAASAMITACGEMQEVAPSQNNTCRLDAKGQLEIHGGTDPVNQIGPSQPQPRRGRQPSQGQGHVVHAPQQCVSRGVPRVSGVHLNIRVPWLLLKIPDLANLAAVKAHLQAIAMQLHRYVGPLADRQRLARIAARIPCQPTTHAHVKPRRQ